VKIKEIDLVTVFFKSPTPTIFVAAPTGVILPPIVVPIIVPKSNR